MFSFQDGLFLRGGFSGYLFLGGWFAFYVGVGIALRWDCIALGLHCVGIALHWMERYPPLIGMAWHFVSSRLGFGIWDGEIPQAGQDSVLYLVIFNAMELAIFIIYYFSSLL